MKFAQTSILILVLISTNAQAVVINDLIASATPGGISNYYDKNNDFPNVVYLLSEPRPISYMCSGTVINSRAVLTAAHCDGSQDAQIRLGPNINTGFYSSLYKASGQQFVSQDGRFGRNDISFLSVSEPILGVKTIPLANQDSQIPNKGDLLTFVGYGTIGTGTDCCQPPDGKRRVATTLLGFYGSGRYTRDAGLWSQFRNPLSPENPNLFDLRAPVPHYSGTVAAGDSGGPVYGYYNGALLQLGVLSGGGNYDGENGEYGDESFWGSVIYFKDWIAQNNPLRQVDLRPGNYNWSDASAWVDSVPGVASVSPNNSLNNVIDGQSNIARYYQVVLNNSGIVSLDMNPTVDSLAIADNRSLLNIRGFTLTTIVDTSLIDGEMRFSGGSLISPNVYLYGGRLTGNGFISAPGISTSAECQNGTICNTGSTISVLGQVSVDANLSQREGALIIQNGHLEVNGNFAQKGGSLVYLGENDVRNSINITGNAELGGSLLVAGLGLPAYLPTKRVKLIHSQSGLTGGFNTIVADANYAFLSPKVAYTTNDAYLDFALTPFSVVGRTINQRNVGNALTLGAYGPISGPSANILNTLFYGSYQSAQSVMDTVGGAGLAGVQTTAMEVGQMVSSTVSDQIAFWRSGEANDMTGVTLHEDNAQDRARSFMAYAPTDVGVTTKSPITIKGPVGGLASPVPPARTYRAWGSMFGGGANFLSDAGRGTPSATAGYYGGLLGVDYQLTPNALVGVSLGGSNAGFSVGSLSTTGNLTGFHAGLYGSYTMGTSYLALNETFSAYSNKTNRSAGGYSFLPYESLAANFGSTEFRTRLEGGHSLLMGGMKATPFVAAEIAAYNVNGFSEQSSLLYQSSLALKNNGQAINSLPTFVGLRLSNAYTLQNGWRLAPIGSLAYVHEFFPQRQFTNILMSMPGQDFNVAGPRSTYNLVQTKLGAQLFLNKAFALYSDFQGEFSSMSQSYGGTAGMKYYW